MLSNFLPIYIVEKYKGQVVVNTIQILLSQFLLVSSHYIQNSSFNMCCIIYCIQCILAMLSVIRLKAFKYSLSKLNKRQFIIGAISSCIIYFIVFAFMYLSFVECKWIYFVCLASFISDIQIKYAGAIDIIKED